jgi:hypothetical protein
MTALSEPGAARLNFPGSGSLLRALDPRTSSYLPVWLKVLGAVVALSAAFAVFVTSGTVQVALGAVGLMAVAFVFPLVIFSGSIGWLLLERTSEELFKFSVGPRHFTDADILPFIALVAITLAPRPAARYHLPPVAVWIAIAAWPSWYLLRFTLPRFTDITFGSSVVDARSITAYLVFVPLAVATMKFGWSSLVRLVTGFGYLACAIALLAWAALATHLIGKTYNPFFNALALNDVRPGGELLVVITITLLVGGLAPKAFGSWIVSAVLLIGELAVSQTLSMVLAAGAGVLLVAVLRWRELRRVTQVALLVAAALSVGVLASGVLNGTRFDLIHRLGQDSAQYRVSEVNAIEHALAEEPQSAIAGAGPGSLIHVPNPFTHKTDVKGDAHNVYAAVALKTGLFGLALYALPAVLIAYLIARRRPQHWQAWLATYLAVAVLSFTVPFVWTAQGSAALFLVYLASGVTVRKPEPPA